MLQPICRTIVLVLGIAHAMVGVQAYANKNETLKSCPERFAGLVNSTEKPLAALKQAIIARESAEGSMGRQIAGSDIVDRARELMFARGYQCSDVVYDEEKDLLSFELLSGTPLISDIRKQGKHVVLGIWGGEPNGTYFQAKNTIALSAEHALLESPVTNTLLHEARHGMYYERMAKGIPSAYDAEVSSPTHQDITNIASYPTFFSFQELSTHAKDIKILQGKAQVKNLDVELHGESLQSIIEAKQKNVNAMAKEISYIADSALAVAKNPQHLAGDIEFAADHDLHDVLQAKIKYKARNGNEAILKVWLPELNSMPNEKLSKAAMMKALEEKLLLMKNNAESH